MNNIYIFFLLILSIIFQIQCSSNTPIAGGSETTNTLVSFTVLYPNGEVANSVAVRIRPTNYTKSLEDSFDSSLIQDVTTNQQGKITIDALNRTDYCIEINDNSGYASLLRLQLPNSIKDTVLLNQILQPYVTISGVLDSTFNSEDSIYIELVGLDRSVKVSQNMEFTISDIPSGNYTIKVFSKKVDKEVKTVDNINVKPNGVIDLQISKNIVNYKTDILIDGTIDGANITENLYNYPLVIRLDSNNFNFSQVDSLPNNILITKTDGQIVPFEIEEWNSRIKKAVLWTLVDTVYAQSKTTLSLTWGDGVASKISQVFKEDNNFTGVWHLNNDLKIENSVDTLIIGENFGAKIINGVISNGYNYENQSYSLLPPEAFATLDSQVTISFWQYGVDVDDKAYITIFDGRENDTASSHLLTVHMPWFNAPLGSNTIYWDATFGGSIHSRIYKEAKPNEYEGEWNYWTFIKDATKSKMYIYKNGQLWLSGDGDNRPIDKIGIFKIGSLIEPYNPNNYNGYLDEFRVSNVVRDSNWIKMDFQTQKIGSNVVKIGVSK